LNGRENPETMPYPEGLVTYPSLGGDKLRSWGVYVILYTLLILGDVPCLLFLLAFMIVFPLRFVNCPVLLIIFVD
jgi:hypothetical protein